MTDLYARLGVRYDDAIERAAAAMDEDYNPDRYPILTAMFRDYAGAALAAVLPDLMAAAWDEGHRAGCADPYAYYHECDCRPNPYRAEGDPR